MSDYSDLMGWVNRPDQVDNIKSSLKQPNFAMQAGPILGSGKGKVQLLYDIIRKVAKSDLHFVQNTGDCVSFGSAGIVDTIRCVQISLGKFEEWNFPTATEVIYALSRVEIGKGQFSGSPGSLGAWAAEAVKRYGTLLRKKYGKYDFTNYSAQKADSMGETGLANELEPEAHQHLVKTITFTKKYEEVRDAIYNGYGVTIASNRGFNNVRDKDGFLRPEGVWSHQMRVDAVDDNFYRPGVCIRQSWPLNWISGPTRNDQPPDSFWCDADVLENDILSEGDSWIYGNFDGYPPQEIDLKSIFPTS